MPLMRELERVVMLRVVDEYWMEHIDAMSDLKQGIGLRGYGATKPIDAYKQEGFEMFEAMVQRHPRGDRAPHIHRPRPQGADDRAQGRCEERRGQRRRRAGQKAAGQESAEAGAQ